MDVADASVLGASSMTAQGHKRSASCDDGRLRRRSEPPGPRSARPEDGLRKAISAIEGRLAWRTEPGWVCLRFLMLRNNDHENAILKLHDISLTRRTLSEKTGK